MKYKNVVQTGESQPGESRSHVFRCDFLDVRFFSIVANRKKAEARKTDDPASLPVTEAGDPDPQSSVQPIAEGVSGGSSSDPATPQDAAYIKS